MFSSTPNDFQTAYEGEIGSLSAVTFWGKVIFAIVARSTVGRPLSFYCITFLKQFLFFQTSYLESKAKIVSECY